MKLYILRPLDRKSAPWNPWYDKSFGFIVCASTPGNARKLAANASGDEGKNAWLHDKYSSCNELIPTPAEGVIMIDFASA